MNNQFTAQYSSSQNTPAAIVLLNGSMLPWTAITVTNKNYYLSDSFEIISPLYASDTFNFNFWSSVSNATIQIYMGFPPDFLTFTTVDLELIFTGIIDNIDIDPLQGSVTITGRDNSALLIDTKITQSYNNQTASDVAEEFALEHDLTAVVTPTSALIGTYNNGYTQLSNSVSEWDFLTFLAQQNNFNLYVINNELHFEPKLTSPEESFTINFQMPNVLSPSPIAPVESIKFGRTLTLAQDIEVDVYSNSQTSGSTFVEKATSSKTNITGAVVTQKQKYSYSIPNLTPQQASARAQQILEQISQHEMLLEFTLPPNVTLTKVMPIQITGTETQFDQIYYLDSIERHLDASQFTMSCQAKNHNTNNQIGAL